MSGVVAAIVLCAVLTLVSVVSIDRRNLMRHLERTVRAYSDLAAEQAAAHDLLLALRGDISQLQHAALVDVTRHDMQDSQN